MKSLSVGDDKQIWIFGLEIGSRLFHLADAFHSHCLIKGRIDLECNGVWSRSVYYLLVKKENGILFRKGSRFSLLFHAGRDFLDVGVQTHTEKTAFFLNLSV